MSVIFEDLPVSPADRIDWDAVGRELSAHPFRWGRVGTFPSRASAATVAYQINHGKKHTRLFAHGRFEAKSRTVDQEYRLYARWIGTATT